MGIVKWKPQPADAEVLAEHLIEYNRAGGKVPIRAGELLKLAEGQVFEQFTRHPTGRLMAAGAFTHIVEGSDNFLQYQIGRYCSIARGTHVVTGHHPLHTVTTNPYHYSDYYKNYLPEHLRYIGPRERFKRDYGRGRIGNDVWIGAHCTIRGGLTIGDGAVIASGSVVMRDVPPYAIVGGNPAKVIRLRFEEEIVSRMIALAWWNYSPVSFRDINMYDVELFVKEMEFRKSSGVLDIFSPARFTVSKGHLIAL